MHRTFSPQAIRPERWSFPAGWQSTIGSFTPNLEMYGDFAALVRELHDKGFRLMLTVTPIRQRRRAYLPRFPQQRSIRQTVRRTHGNGRMDRRIQRFLRHHAGDRVRNASPAIGRAARQPRGRRLPVRLRRSAALRALRKCRGRRISEKMERTGQRISTPANIRSAGATASRPISTIYKRNVRWNGGSYRRWYPISLRPTCWDTRTAR